MDYINTPFDTTGIMNGGGRKENFKLQDSWKGKM